MPRIMTNAMKAALASATIRLALMASLQFGDNTVYLWSGLGSMTWNGMTFQGIGSLGSVGEISEDSEVEAKNVVISLSGIPSGLLNEVLWETRVLRTAKIWLALYDINGSLIADPLLSYQGMMDQPEIDNDGQHCTISLSLENILVDLNRAVYRRYTADDQQIDLAATLTRLGLPSNTADTGFQHVAGVQETKVYWGRVPNSVNN